MATRVKNTDIEVWNGSSFVSFSGVIKSQHTKILTVSFSDDTTLICSETHRIKLRDRDLKGRWQSRFIKAKDLKVGNVTSTGLIVSSIVNQDKDIFLYDLSDVKDHEYASGSVISHNCEFLSSDPLLIKSMTLQMLKEAKPLYVDKGFSFWKKIDPNRTYIIGADVAEGVNQDFSTVQVIELETLEQVAEFRNNSINESQLYNAIKWIIENILSNVDPRTRKKPTVMWSFENNSAGAAIGTLYYQDEKFPEDAQLINGKGERLGMRTVNKPKIEACRHLKTLVEKSNGLKIRSRLLIFELKNYVSTGASYAAKPGATDDLVSAMLIVIRVLKQVSEYEPEVFDKLYKSESDFYDETTNDYDDPIPFVVS